MSTNSDSKTAANKRLVRRWFDKVWSEGNEDASVELVAADSAFHDPASQGMIPPTHEAHYAAYRTAFPDLTFTVEDMIAEGNTVGARFTATGTHKGEFLNYPPRGESFEITGIVFNHIRDGRIIETWPVWDVLGLMHQLGLDKNA